MKPQNPVLKHSMSALAVCTLGITGASAALSDWSGTAAGGLTITDGNSETSIINAEAEATKAWDIHALTIGGDLLIGEVGDVTTNELLHGYVNYTRDIGDPWYAGLNGDVLHDDLAELDYRLGLFPYIGYKAVDDGRLSLTFEAGPGYIWEDQAGLESDYAALRLAENLEYQLNERTKLWQSLEWVAEFEDFDNSLTVAEIGVDTKISDKLSVRALARWRFDGDVPAGIDDSDVVFITALGYGFGGDEDGDLEEKTAEDLAAARDDMEIAGAWVTTGLAGLTIAEGNSESLLATGNIHTAREWDIHTVDADLGLVYGELEGVTAVQAITGGLAYGRELSDPWFFTAGADFLHDDIAQVDYRLSVWPALGVTLLDDGRTSLTAQGGPAYVFEEVGGVSADYVAARARADLEHQLSETTKLHAGVEWLAEIDDFDNNVVSAEVGAEIDMGSGLTFNALIQTVTDNTPAPGLEETDLRIVTGIGYEF